MVDWLVPAGVKGVKGLTLAPGGVLLSTGL